MDGGIIVVCIDALYMFDDADSSTRSQLFYQIQFPFSLRNDLFPIAMIETYFS